MAGRRLVSPGTAGVQACRLPPFRLSAMRACLGGGGVECRAQLVARRPQLLHLPLGGGKGLARLAALGLRRKGGQEACMSCDER